MPSLPSIQPWQQKYAGVDREAIWTALFAWFQTQIGGYFTTMSRKHLMPPELSLEAQPAFFLVQLKEQRAGSTQGTPNKLAMHGCIVIYLPAPETNETPGSETQLAATNLNAIYRAIDYAMVPDNLQTGKFTVGGLVTHCWIEGDLDQDPGIFSSQAAAILPIHILVP